MLASLDKVIQGKHSSHTCTGSSWLRSHVENTVYKPCTGLTGQGQAGRTVHKSCMAIAGEGQVWEKGHKLCTGPSLRRSCWEHSSLFMHWPQLNKVRLGEHSSEDMHYLEVVKISWWSTVQKTCTGLTRQGEPGEHSSEDMHWPHLDKVRLRGTQLTSQSLETLDNVMQGQHSPQDMHWPHLNKITGGAQFTRHALAPAGKGHMGENTVHNWHHSTTSGRKNTIDKPCTGHTRQG